MIEKIELTEKQIGNAKEILGIIDELEHFDMKYFVKLDEFDELDESPEFTEETLIKVNACNTSFCLLGWQGYKDNFPKEFFDSNGDFRFDWYAGLKLDLVDAEFTRVWNYFYSQYWPSDKGLAKWKLEKAIELGYIVNVGKGVYVELYTKGIEPTLENIEILIDED